MAAPNPGLRWTFARTVLSIGVSVCAAAASGGCEAPAPERVAHASAPLSLGPSSMHATDVATLNSSDIAPAAVTATPAGYAVAYLRATGQFTFELRVTFLAADGSVSSGPFVVYSGGNPNFRQPNVRGLTWDGNNVFIVHEATDITHDLAQTRGYTVSPSGATALVFEKSGQWEEGTGFIGSKSFRPVLHNGSVWVSGTQSYYNFSCELEDHTIRRGGGYAASAPTTLLECGHIAVGPGSSGVCVSAYHEYDPCLRPGDPTIDYLRLDTVPPSAPIILDPPPIGSVSVVAAHDDTVVLISNAGFQSTGGVGLSLLADGTTVGAVPIPDWFKGDVAWVVDRFVLATTDGLGISIASLDADGIAIVDPFTTVVASGTRPLLAARDDGNALLAYVDGTTLYTAVISVTGGGGGGGGGGAGGEGGAGGAPAVSSSTSGTGGEAGAGGSSVETTTSVASSAASTASSSGATTGSGATTSSSVTTAAATTGSGGEDGNGDGDDDGGSSGGCSATGGADAGGWQLGLGLLLALFGARPRRRGAVA
jgi:hypothetical protein